MISGEEWRKMGQAVLEQGQRAAVAAVVGGMARTTVARIPVVGTNSMLTKSDINTGPPVSPLLPNSRIPVRCGIF